MRCSASPPTWRPPQPRSPTPSERSTSRRCAAARSCSPASAPVPTPSSHRCWRCAPRAAGPSRCRRPSSMTRAPESWPTRSSWSPSRVPARRPSPRWSGSRASRWWPSPPAATARWPRPPTPGCRWDRSPTLPWPRSPTPPRCRRWGCCAMPCWARPGRCGLSFPGWPRDCWSQPPGLPPRWPPTSRPSPRSRPSAAARAWPRRARPRCSRARRCGCRPPGWRRASISTGPWRRWPPASAP